MRVRLRRLRVVENDGRTATLKTREISMFKRRDRIGPVVAAVTAMAALAACSSSADPHAVSDSAPPVVGMDPCEGMNGDAHMCRIVATAPLLDAGQENPIAIVLTGKPSLEVRVGLPGKVATFASYPGSAGTGQGLGPLADNFADVQDHVLEAVSSVRGGPGPDIIVWTSELLAQRSRPGSDARNEYQVLTLDSSHDLIVVPAPGGGSVWTTSHGSNRSSTYHCNPGQPGVTPGSVTVAVREGDSTTGHDFQYIDGVWMPDGNRDLEPRASDSANFDNCAHVGRPVDRRSGDKTTFLTPR